MTSEIPKPQITEITVDEARAELEARVEAFEPVEGEGHDGGRLFNGILKGIVENPESLEIFTARYNEIARLQREIDAGF